MRLTRAGLVLAILATLVVAAAPADALTPRQAEIEAERRELREKIRQADQKATSLTQQLNESNARRKALEAEIAITSSRLREAEARLASAEADLATARVELFGVEAQLAQNLGRQDRLREQMESRTRTAYKIGGGGLYVEILLGARSFQDFVSRLNYVSSVITEDRSMLTDAEEIGEQLTDARGAAIAKRDDITAQKVVIENERANIASLQSQLRSSRQKVDKEIAVGQQLLTKVKADKAGYLRQMALLEKESRSIAAMLRSRQRGQVYQAGSGKKLAWPTTGSVSSAYGYRTHPIFGDRRMHSGIDISGPYGQAIVAAESGTVIFSGIRGGYGTTLIIDHGGALATLYAHMSSVGVGTGATVTRGQRVGSVGCSGYCTGPHLHFETRVNGDPVNPMQFF